MRTPILALSLLSVPLFLTAPLAGHGDPFVPPPRTLPNPAERGGPGAGPGRARPGSALPGIPESLRPSGAPVPAGAARPTSPNSSLLLDMTSWLYWWEFNKEPFLELRERLDADSVFSGSDGFFLGHGRRSSIMRIGNRPDDEEVRGRIVPALKRALCSRPSNDVIDAVLIALARIGNDRPLLEQMEIESVIRPFLRDDHGKTSRTAVAALGILGRGASALLLGELLVDSDAGREILRDSRVPSSTRAFAAYSLGLLGNRSENEDVRRFVVGRLARALETDDTGSPDLSAACAIAIGRVPLTWAGRLPDRRRGQVVGMLHAAASREEQILLLLGLLRDRKGDRFVRAHAATSLAVLTLGGDAPNVELIAEVGEELVGRLNSRKREPREVLQSCAMALGVLGDGAPDRLDELEVQIRDSLIETISSASDISARRFAMIAAARVAARPASASAADPTPVRQALLRQLSRGGSEDRCWAALALSILERSRVESRHPADEASLLALRTALREARAPLDVAAFALASGIVGDREATDELLEQLEQTREDTSKGLVAVGLGLVDAREAADEIQALVEDSTYRPRLLREASIALGLLGDGDLIDILLSRLRDTRSLAARSSIAQALARIGDARTVDPLLQMLEDPEISGGARSYAAIALGLVADRDALPWNMIYSVNTNYLASTPTLFGAQSLGILNLL
jgi:hypothetical protein